MTSREPLGEPPARLSAAELAAWREIEALATVELYRSDRIALETAAALRAAVRAGREDLRAELRAYLDLFGIDPDAEAEAVVWEPVN